jgi:hypothetical protein
MIDQVTEENYQTVLSMVLGNKYGQMVITIGDILKMEIFQEMEFLSLNLTGVLVDGKIMR